MGKGSSFHIFLPEAKRAIQRQESFDSTVDLRGNEMIMVVEDEPVLGEMIRSALNGYGYSTIGASNGPAALEIWKEQKETIHLLLTDMIMPQGMTGYELSLFLMKYKPSLKVIYMSGYSMEGMSPENLSAADNFLSKPFSMEKLLLKMRSILNTGKQDVS